MKMNPPTAHQYPTATLIKTTPQPDYTSVLWTIAGLLMFIAVLLTFTLLIMPEHRREEARERIQRYR